MKTPDKTGPAARERSKAWVALRRAAIFGAGLGAGGLIATAASAAGFYIQEQSARGAGRAYSGEAADTGVESIWWNPAAIARLRAPQAYVGGQAILVDAAVEDTGSTLRRPGQATAPVGGQPRQSKSLQPGVAPSAGVAYPVGDRFVIGASVTSPFNFTNKYGAASWTRYDALKSRVTDANIEVVGAVRVSDRLDLGLGLDAQYVSATLTQALPNLSPAAPDALQRLSGHGWDYGWDAGAQYHASDRLTLAASYRSKIRHSLHGDVSVTGLLGPLAGANLGDLRRGELQYARDRDVRRPVARRPTGCGSTPRSNGSAGASSAPSPSVVPEPRRSCRRTTGRRRPWLWAPTTPSRRTGPCAAACSTTRHRPPTPAAARGFPTATAGCSDLGASHRLSNGATVEINADYIAFAKSRVNRNNVAFAGTPVATPVSLRGTCQRQRLRPRRGRELGASSARETGAALGQMSGEGWS